MVGNANNREDVKKELRKSADTLAQLLGTDEFRWELYKSVVETPEYKKLPNTIQKSTIASDFIEQKKESEIKVPSPQPDRDAYTEIRNSTDDSGRALMKENILERNGQGEIKIKCNKRSGNGERWFSLLQQKSDDNNPDIFTGAKRDSQSKQGISGVTYARGTASNREILMNQRAQNMDIFRKGQEVDDFVQLLPGNDIATKANNLAKLLGLGEAGFLWKNMTGSEEMRREVGETGYLGMTCHGAGESIYYISWGKQAANQINSTLSMGMAMPYLVYRTAA